MPIPQHPTSHTEELHREAFNILPGKVNARQAAGLVHTSGLSQSILVTGRAHFKDELAEEVTWASHSQLHHVHFAADLQRGFTSNPRKLPEKQQSRARLNPTTYPASYKMKLAVQEFHKLCKSKINKLKGGYSAMASLIFQSWLKDIKVHVEDQNLTERKDIHWLRILLLNTPAMK